MENIMNTFYELDNYNCILEQKQVKNWILEDAKEALFELKGYVMMKDVQMIDYWTNVVDYFRNFVKDIYNYNLNQIVRDFKFGNDSEQYASGKILARLGIRT